MKKIMMLATSIVMMLDANGVQNDFGSRSNLNKRKFSEVTQDYQKYGDRKGKKRCVSSEPDETFLDLESSEHQVNNDYFDNSFKYLENQVVSLNELKDIVMSGVDLIDLCKLQVQVKGTEILDWNIIYQMLAISPFLKVFDISDEHGGFGFYNTENNGLLVNRYNFMRGNIKLTCGNGKKSNYGIIDMIQDNVIARDFSYGLFRVGNGFLKLELDIINNKEMFSDADGVVLSEAELLNRDFSNLDFSEIKKLKVSLPNGGLEENLDLKRKFDNLMDKVGLTLETLDLSGNNLKKVPESVRKCEKLKELDLSENKELQNLPKWLKDSKLESLFLIDTMTNKDKFPEEIWEVSSLKKLIAGNTYSDTVLEISPKIANLTNLEQLNLAGRRLSFVPKEIRDLKKLQILDLSNCGLRGVPEEIYNLTDLRELSLANNNLELVSLGITNLRKLERLILSAVGQLEYLVPDLERLTNLKVLDLSYCGLYDLPLNFDKLKHLQELRLRGNYLKSISNTIDDLKDLSVLDLRDNKLSPEFKFSGQNIIDNRGIILVDDENQAVRQKQTNIKEVVPQQLKENIDARGIKDLNSTSEEDAFLLKQGGVFSDVEELSIDPDFLDEISVDSLSFPNLEALKINVPSYDDSDYESLENLEKIITVVQYNDKIDALITKVSPTIGSLIMHNVNLKTIPESVLACKNLGLLELMNCGIEKLPSNIDTLSELFDLNLDNNKLKTLPESFGNLINLNNVKLSLNNLETIPSSIVNLRNLDILDLRGNRLSVYPEEISNLLNLIDLDLSENFIREIPASINNLLKLDALSVQSSVLEKLPDFKHSIFVRDLNHDLSVKRFLPANKSEQYVYEKLDLSNKNLTQVPFDISNYSIKELDISNNQLASIPALIQKVRGLEKLNLKGNNIYSIDELPDEIFGIRSLNSIIISTRQCPEFIDDQSIRLIDMENNCYILEYKKPVIEYIRFERIRNLQRKIEKIQVDKDNFERNYEQISLSKANKNRDIVNQADTVMGKSPEDFEYIISGLDNKLEILNQSRPN